MEDLERLGLGYVMRGGDYLLDVLEVQACLTRPPDEQTTHPEAGTCHVLFDCPDTSLTAAEIWTRVIVATGPSSTSPSPIGTTLKGVLYELFFTALPQDAFPLADVVNLSLFGASFLSNLSSGER